MIELLVALMVMAIALAVGVPAFQNSVANSNLRSTTMDLVTALNTARAEAVSRRTPIRVKPAAGGWKDGWLVDYAPSKADGTQSEDLQRYEPQGSSTIEKTGDTGAIDFRSDGMVEKVSTGTVGTATFLVCDGRPDERGRTITVNRFGKLDNQVHADGSTCK